MISAGYKWLLGPSGHRVFSGQIRNTSPKCGQARFTGWLAEGAENSRHSPFADPKPVEAADAGMPLRPQLLNLAAMDAGIDLVLRIGAETVAAIITIDRLSFLRASAGSLRGRKSLDSKHADVRAASGRSPEKTKEFYEKLEMKCHHEPSRRKIRVSPTSITVSGTLPALSVITV